MNQPIDTDPLAKPFRPRTQRSIVIGLAVMVAAATATMLVLPVKSAVSTHNKDQVRIHFKLDFDPSSIGTNGLGTDGRFIPTQPWKFDPTTGRFEPQQ